VDTMLWPEITRPLQWTPADPAWAVCKTAIPGSIPGVAASRLRSKWPREFDFWGRSRGLDGTVDGNGIQAPAVPTTEVTRGDNIYTGARRWRLWPMSVAVRWHN